MTREKIMVDLFGFSAPTYYKWTKHQKRKIFDLLSYAFSDKELEEFLTTNKIGRIEEEKSYKLLFDLSISFFKRLMRKTNYIATVNCLKLLEESYKANNSKLVLHKFINELYLKQENVFNFQTIEEISSIKFKIVEQFKNENIATLNYICINLDEIIKFTEDLKEK